MVDHALLADPNCPDANSASSLLAGGYEGDWGAALEAANRALKTGPGDARVMRRVAGVMAYSGDTQRAVELAQQSVRVDPLNVSGFTTLGLSLLRAERWPEARTALQEVLKLSDQSIGTHAALGIVALMEGNPELALKDGSGEADLMRRDTISILAHHDMGQTELAGQELEKFIVQYQQTASYDVATIYAHMGESDKAFEWLDRATMNDDPGINTMGADPLLKKLRGDTRWDAMRDKVGLPG
jgi:tetratricopeptide (TPR) repeat protein